MIAYKYEISRQCYEEIYAFTIIIVDACHAQNMHDEE